MTTHHDPQEALRLINEEGALLIDVREPDEHARERIPNAKLVPLSRLTVPLDRHEAQLLIFHCRSGSRTGAAAEKLAVAAGGDAHILRGGLNAWKAAGLPVLKDTRRPIEIMRQVQIAAGSLVILGVGLGALLHPGRRGRICCLTRIGMVKLVANESDGVSRYWEERRRE